MSYLGEEGVALIKEVGVSRLGGYDGCACTSFEVRGFEVCVGCRKGSGGHIGSQIDPDFYGTIVRVSSGHMDIDETDCALVAQEVLRQVSEGGGDAQAMIRLCSYQDDAEGRCRYCHAPRTERWGYFCEKHLTPDSRNRWANQ
jgi:hypothetical protein